MHMNDYQDQALRTMSDESGATHDSMLNTAALGLAGEAGEFAEMWKKYLYHGHPIDHDRMAKEVGDVLWYCAIAARGLGFSLGFIAESNIEKLRHRYPEKFSSIRSINKVDG